MWENGYMPPTVAAAAAVSKLSKVTKLQKAHWASYLASGHRIHALFNLFDKDVNGKLSRSELQKFLVAVQAVSSPLPPTTMAAMTASSTDDHSIDFPEFKNRLMHLTQEITHSLLLSSLSSGGGGTCFQPLYETSPHTHDCRLAGLQQLPAPPKYMWNMSTICQAMCCCMQYAVHGEVVMATEKLATKGQEIIGPVGTGAYTHLQELPGTCKQVANFIAR